MRLAWLAVGLLALTLSLGRPAFAGPAPVGCCVCTFCGVMDNEPSICADGIVGDDGCDTLCMQANDTCDFSTLVGGSACAQVPSCVAVADEPVSAPAMSGLTQMLLALALGTFGYATLARRSSTRS